MTKSLEALTPEKARESGSILIIVAARLIRMEALRPLHVLSELGQKTIGTRAMREAIERTEETLRRDAVKIRDGHDMLSKKLREAEAALEQKDKRIAELEEENKFDTAKLINKFYTRYPLESFKSDPERSEALGYYMAGAEVQHFGDFVVYEMPEDDEEGGE